MENVAFESTSVYTARSINQGFVQSRRSGWHRQGVGSDKELMEP